MTAALWSYSDLVLATGGRLVGTPRTTIRGIAIDSRTLVPGDAFFAIKGDRFDGHDFVAAALKAGAAIAVVAEDALAGLSPEGPYLVVPDVLAGLVHLGIAARARSPAHIVAVTGSVGKTGTKEALRLALSKSGETHASLASFNNHWGVPLTLARMPRSAAFGVFEIGMNHAGEITPLVAQVRPHVAIVTTVGPVHLEFFDSVDGIAEAKAEIFTGLEPGGAAVINRDIAQFELLAERATQQGARVVSFGEHAAADARLLNLALQPSCSAVSASIFGADVTYKVGAPGRHVVQNSLGVLAASVLLGADLALSALALADLTPPKGRGERIHLDLPRGGGFTLIDESYNANPASMKAAIALLGATKPEGTGRRIAVLGDMRELGPTADALHAGLAEPLQAHRVDLVYLAGPHMQSLWRALPEGRRGAYASSSAELESVVLDAVHPGDVVMIKGSLGSRMGPIVDGFKTRFRLAPAAVGEDGV